MSKIELTTDERAALVAKLKLYFSEELGQTIGRFDAEFMLDFLLEELGPVFYNRGLYDAQAVLEKRIESIGEAIYELEKPTGLIR